LARWLLSHVVVKNLRELLAASTSGILSTGIDLGALLLLVGHHVPVPVATFVAALAGAVANFALNKYVAFRDRSPINLRQLARFHAVFVVAALLMAGAMELVVSRLGAPMIAAKLACAALVFAVWTYPAQRRFVFARELQAT
jgi:putative flippase GtrA